MYIHSGMVYDTLEITSKDTELLVAAAFVVYFDWHSGAAPLNPVQNQSKTLQNAGISSNIKKEKPLFLAFESLLPNAG